MATKRKFDGRTSKLVTEVEEIIGTEIDSDCKDLLADVVKDYSTAAEMATSSATESVSSAAEAFINATADYAERLNSKGRDAGSVFSDINEVYVNSRDVVIDKISTMVKYAEKISKILDFLASSKNDDITKELISRGVEESDLETLLSFDKSLYALISNMTLNMGVTGVAQNYLDGAKDLVGNIYAKVDGKLDKEDLIAVADLLGLETAYDVKGSKGDLRDKASLRAAAKEKAAERAAEYAEGLGARKIADLTPRQLEKYNAIKESYMEDEDDDDFYLGSKKSGSKKKRFYEDDDDDFRTKKKGPKSPGGLFSKGKSGSIGKFGGSRFGSDKSESSFRSKLKKSRFSDDSDDEYVSKKSYDEDDGFVII